MRKKITILGLLLGTFLIAIPVEGFAGNLGVRPASVEANSGTQVVVSYGKPRRKRRKMWRNGRFVWVTYSPSRRYRTVRRYYYVGGVRRARMVRVYY